MIVQPGQRLVDYAAGNKNPYAILAGGYVGAIRYICDNIHSWKHITLAERDALLAAGLALAVVWETTTIRAFAGAAAGRQDGLTARARLQWLGYPPNVPVLLAFDTDITKKTLAAATAYGRAFKDACGWPLIPYGDTDIGDALADITEGTWLPNASAWSRLIAWISGGNEHVVVRQRKVDLANGWDPNDVIRPITMWSSSTPAEQTEVEPPVVVQPSVPGNARLAHFGSSSMWTIIGIKEWQGTGDAGKRFAWNGAWKVNFTSQDEADQFILGNLTVAEGKPGHDLDSPYWMPAGEANKYQTVSVGGFPA